MHRCESGISLQNVVGSATADRVTGGHWAVRKKLHAKERTRAMQRRFGVVAISDSADRHRGASGSRRSVDIFPFQESTGSAQLGLKVAKPEISAKDGSPRKRVRPLSVYSEDPEVAFRSCCADSLSSPCRTKVLTNDLQSEQLPVLVCYAMVWISAKCHVQRENLG